MTIRVAIYSYGDLVQEEFFANSQDWEALKWAEEKETGEAGETVMMSFHPSLGAIKISGDDLLPLVYETPIGRLSDFAASWINSLMTGETQMSFQFL